jgi:hypothetical protein
MFQISSFSALQESEWSVTKKRFSEHDSSKGHGYFPQYYPSNSNAIIILSERVKNMYVEPRSDPLPI